MKFRVSGVGLVLSVSVSIVGRAWAQTAPVVNQPAASDADRSAPAQAAFPPVEPTAAPAATTPVPAAPAPAPAPQGQSLAAITHQGDEGPPPDREALPAVQPYFAFGAQVGFYNPNGLTLHVGVPAVALEATAGFSPLLVNYDSYSAYQSNALKFLMPFEVAPQLVIHVLTFKHEVRANLLLGYRYNRALGSAAALGGEIESRVSRHLVLQGMWGIAYYPDAADHLRNGGHVPADASFKFPPSAGYGLSVGLLFYP